MLGKMKNAGLTILALLPLLFLVSPALAANSTTVTDISVTVTEQNAFEGHDVYHTDDFDTTLQATVSGSPTPGQELKIVSGPIYTWSAVAKPYTMPTSGSSVDLQGAAPATRGWPAGVNDVTVSVTVSWMDDAGNSYTTVPKSYTVHFFSKWPQSSEATLETTHRVGPNETGIYQKPYWGHASIYLIQVFDNDMPQDLYGRGILNESFSNTQLNPKYASNLIAQGAPAVPHPGDLTQSNPPGFTFDTTSWFNDSWTNPPPSDTGDQTLWYQTVQSLDVAETWARGYTDTPVGSYTLYTKQGEEIRVKNVR